MKMTKISALLSCIVSIGFATQNIRTDSAPLASEQIYKQRENFVKMMASELSRQLPQQVDRYTTLLKVEPKKNTLLYIFSINDKNKTDEAIVKEDHSRMEKVVTRGVCLKSKKLFESGINTTYVYKSAKTGRELFHFDITKEKCLRDVFR